MAKPMVAIVGRPNVGKSTLFNMLAGSALSIVEDIPGVTRDRVHAEGTWLDHQFTLVDTGGIEPDSKDVILSHIREQAEIAVHLADVIVFVVDVRQGLTDTDEKVAIFLRKSKKPIILCVNKVDHIKKWMNDVYEFYQLGLGDPLAVSATGKLGLGELLDEVVSHFPQKNLEEEEEETPKIAVIGKPNVGKSSLINRLLGEERLIVSDMAGTTRDAIDTKICFQGKEYILIDTAGIRRKSKVKENLERYSVIRSIFAVNRADIVILLIDATEGVTEQDAKIAGIAHEKGKGLLIAVNKWDAIEKNDKTIYEHQKKIRQVLSYLNYAECLFISALSGQRLTKLFPLIDTIIHSQNNRVSTGALNEIISEATVYQQAPSDKGKHLKIYYSTQVSVKPPTFVLFVNDKELAHFSYIRYLENQIRSTFGFKGTPLKWIIRERRGKYND
ncbi:GTPase Der [Clostridia bacterium]|nr:GTPase Der [Clostridia bacterium]